MVTPELAEQISNSARNSCLEVVSPLGFRASGEQSLFSGFFPRDASLTSEARLFRLSRKILSPQSLRQISVKISPDKYRTPIQFTAEEKTVLTDTLLPVKNSLRTMVQFQGKTRNDWRDEEPGKIAHELRFWDPEQTTANNNVLRALIRNKWPVDDEGMCYYGSVDSTPLFVMSACKYLTLTEDANFLLELDDPIRKAINWMTRYGDIKNDTFIRFQAKNRNALINQGWKDSGNSINYPQSNEKVKEPIALVEVQGYQYLALKRAAKMYEKLDQAYSYELNGRAKFLKENFNRDFWMPEARFFAQALDGNNRQVTDIVSNVGHLLITDIIDDDKVPFVVERLTRPDMLTNHGIRTLSSLSPHYTENDPESYHNGSIWPHDNCIIAIGLIKLGYNAQANIIRDSILEAEFELMQKYGARQSELYIETLNGNLRPYKYAQQPQTWVMESDRVFTDPDWPLPLAA